MRSAFVPVAAALALALATPPAAASAQEELARAEAAIDRGRFAEARERVERWWEGPGAATASREDRQRALWLRARLTVDPEMAELDFRRLVLEYPQGRFTDLALFRLAQGAEARGDPAAARRYLEMLAQDYPTSPLRPEARDRLSRFPEARGPAGPWAVQIGAFSSDEAAHALAERARAAGLGVRVVRVEGSPLFRVRMGAFDTREEAEAELRRSAGRGFPGFVSGDRDRESPADP